MKDSTTSKWVSLIAKLLQLTQEGKIKWTLQPPPPGKLPATERVSQVYATAYEGQGLRIYEYDYKTLVPDFSDDLEWDRRVKLELVDATGRSLYAISQEPGLDDLLRAVKHQTSNVDAFLEKLGIS